MVLVTHVVLERLRDTLIRTPLITLVVLGMTKASGYDWLKVLLSITQLEFKYYCYENVKIRTPSLIVYQAHLPAMVCGLTGRELTHGEVRDHFIENEKFPRFLALSNSQKLFILAKAPESD